MEWPYLIILDLNINGRLPNYNSLILNVFFNKVILMDD